MKQYVFLLSILLLLRTAHAQIGVRAGGSLDRFTQASTTRQDYDFTYSRAQSSPRLGYHLGLYYAQRLSTRLSLVPELQFSREQVRIEAFNYALPDAHYDSDYTVRTAYLNVPVLLRWRRGPLYVEAGPQVSLLLAGREQGQVGVSSVGWGTRTEPLDHDVMTSYRRFDAGPCLGVGVQLPAGLGLSVRAYQGLVALTEVTEVTYAAQPYVSGQRRQLLQASLTYQFGKPQP